MKAATYYKQCSTGPDGAAGAGRSTRSSASGATFRSTSHARRRHAVALRAAPGEGELAAASATPVPLASDQGGSEHANRSVPRVLHVDSDDGAAAILTALLMPEATVVHVSTVAEARRLLRTEIFSLCILDPGLSDGDGGTLLPALATTPLLVYSARQPEWRDQPRPYLPKPWTSPRQLWSTISTMLGIAPGMSAGD